MKKLISWIVLIPIGVVVVVFAIFNRAPVSFDLWPFAYRIDVPLFIAVFAGVLIGFILGVGVMMLALGRARRARRAQMYRAEDAEREARYLKNELDKAQNSARQNAAGGVPATAMAKTGEVVAPPPAAY
ncbi:lipopolysaccharide assembly protein LapA domain-containing protein [Varunaivibrio sulfuroxidans]|uniref:lipopolysaccharide assembly protein LapA domain-containing protein n=1 Tax=Varunaivibrio sulfuroxidans TaxID=1773489 RepID=UPI0014049106|nr:lipopolysaccharide assembly protein LapA domain-containing protein [Varunaivibrio sulfuroxidans]WES29498.1 lipopolysaccharide assembly protein LapA domain-containing protein [Varunaivibrio sulfuroxidans]